MKIWDCIFQVKDFFSKKKNWNKQYPEIYIPSELKCHKIWQKEADIITEKYSLDRKNEILFYGPSNFARWTTMDEDMKEYKVQNHAFGGCTDVELVGYADQLLFPYDPCVIFFQTGSNDYVQQSGSNEEKIKKSMKYKRAMFEAFHRQLPDAKMVAMSGLLLPGRAQYVDMTIEINRQLKALAEELSYLYYVDANAMTYDGKHFNEALFVEDQIHLNHEGQLKWYNEYIHPAIEQLITEYPELKNMCAAQ